MDLPDVRPTRTDHDDDASLEADVVEMLGHALDADDVRVLADALEAYLRDE